MVAGPPAAACRRLPATEEVRRDGGAVRGAQLLNSCAYLPFLRRVDCLPGILEELCAELGADWSSTALMVAKTHSWWKRMSSAISRRVR